DSFQECLRQIHVVIQVVEGHFRLDHPEFGQMPGRVRILGTKRWPKRVHLAQGRGEDLRLKLAADRQVRGTAKEIAGEVGAFAREFGEIKRRDLEHLAGAFTVTRRDDRRMNVQKALLLKEIMDRSANAIANPRHGTESVGPWPKMRHRSQELEGMP